MSTCSINIKELRQRLADNGLPTDETASAGVPPPASAGGGAGSAAQAALISQLQK